MPSPRTALSVALLLPAALLALPSTAAAQGAPERPDPRTGPAAPDHRPGVPDHVLERVARTHGWSVARVEALLAADPAVRVSGEGRLFYVDAGAHDEPSSAAATSDGTAPRTTAAMAYPSSQTFFLHSRPGSERTVYLDFDGHRVSGTAWNKSTGMPGDHYAGLDADGDPSTFSSAERAIVQDVWQRVAEDFAPYDVDVTTEDPGEVALTRDSRSDATFGMRALISSDQRARDHICQGMCVGVAFVDVFDVVAPTPGYYQPAWTFSSAVQNSPVQIAETVTHEVGHTLALVHDSHEDGAVYYEGNGFWSPIMGAGWGALTQFSKGEYAGALNEGGLQDDFAVMDAAGLDFRADDHDGRNSPTPLGATAAGVIEDADDADWFVLEQGCTGPSSVGVRPAPRGPNLDAQLTVIRPDGSRLTTDPAAGPSGDTWSTWFEAIGLDAVWADDVPAGQYLVGVDGVGQGDPGSDGYSDYGSVGAYTVTMSAACATVVPSLETSEDPVRPGRTGIRKARPGTRGGRDTATVRWREPASTGGAEITRYRITALKVSRSGKVLERTRAKAGPAKRAKQVRLERGRYRFVVRAVNEVGTGRKSRRSNTVRAR